MDYKDYAKHNNIDTRNNDPVLESSNLITEARLYAGISQSELAKKIGTQQPSIARAESGAVVPSISFLQKIADAVGTYLIPPRFGFMAERDRVVNIFKSISLPTHSIKSAYKEFTSYTSTETKQIDFKKPWQIKI